MAYSNPSLSYPKPRDVLTKIISIARTDSSTAKAVLPKDAVVMNLIVVPTVVASTNAATWTVGWVGAPSALLNAYSVATAASVGVFAPGTAAGTGIMTKLDSDKQVIATFGGTSTAGAIGYVIIEYFIAGPGEAVDD